MVAQVMERKHKHRRVGRADMPAWGSHTQAPVVSLIRRLPDILEACFLMVSCTSFAPTLRGLSTLLTSGAMKAHGYSPSWAGGWAPD